MAKSRMSKLIDRYIVRDGKNFRLKDIDPGDTGSFKTDKSAAEGILKEGVERLCDLQEKLYAQDRWGVLLVFQAMDAAGKDGAIKHVMSGINPQGCQVLFLQAALVTGSRPRLPVAKPGLPAGTGSHRDLQSLVLRGSARRSRPSRAAVEAADPQRAGDEAHLEGTLRGHQRARTLSRTKRLCDPQVLPAPVQEGTGEAFREAARRAREAVEVLAGRPA